MSSDVKKYKGPTPTPATGQTVKEFEDEELAKPQYAKAGLPITVAGILASEDEFEDVINQPQFQAMLKLDDAPTDDAKKADDDSKVKEQPKPKEDVNNPSPEALAVAPEPVIPDQPPPLPAELDEPSEPKLESAFMPQLRVNRYSITSKLGLKKTDSFLQLQTSGLEDMFPTLPSDIDTETKIGDRLFRAAMRFTGMGTVDPLSYSGDGFANPALHNFTVDNDISPFSSQFSERALKERYVDAHIVTNISAGRTAAIRNGFILPTDLTDVPHVMGVEMEGNSAPIDLALEPRGVQTPLKCTHVYANPERLPYLFAAMKCHQYMWMDYERWINLHQGYGFLSANARLYIQSDRLTLAREVRTSSVHEQSLFPRLVFGVGAQNSNQYYYGDHINEPERFCRDSLQRSYTGARLEAEHLTASTENFVARVTGMKAGADFVTYLASVPSDKGAASARVMCAHAMGGHRCALEVEPIPVEILGGVPFGALCAFSSAMVYDVDLLTRDSITHLLTSMLLPFYDPHAHWSSTPAPNGAQRQVFIEGIHEIINGYFARAGAAAGAAAGIVLQRVPTRFQSFTSSGQQQGRALRQTLEGVINSALARQYAITPITSRLFQTPFQNVYLPFVARADIMDFCLHGRRAPGVGGDTRYDTSAHTPAADEMKRNLITYARCLAMLDESRYLNLSLEKALTGRTNLQTSMGLICSTIMTGVQNPDLLPATRGYAAGQNIFEPADMMELPWGGALALILHGVTSSKIESTPLYIKYADNYRVTMPSGYPFYVGFHRTLIYRIVTTLIRARDMIVYREKVVSLIVAIMKQVFNHVDARCEELTSELLEAPGMPGFPNQAPGNPLPITFPLEFINGGAIMPRPQGEALTAAPVPDHSDWQRGAAGDPLIPLLQPVGPALFNAMPLGAPYTMYEATKARVRVFYIMNQAIAPMHFVCYDRTETLIYTCPTPAPATTIELEDLIANRHMGAISFTVSELRDMAHRYVLDGRIGQWTAIAVRDVFTDFEIVAEKDRTDVIKPKDLTISIERDSERHRDDKFKAPRLQVYYHVLGDRSQRAGVNALREAQNMAGMLCYVLIPWDIIRRTFAHFDGVDVDNVHLYSHMARGTGNVLRNQAHLPMLRVRDAFFGQTYSGRLVISTREKESYTFMSEIVKRMLPGTR